jgi:hypothetical protein
MGALAIWERFEQFGLVLRVHTRRER